ncbi:DUF6366 family protein [Psychrobacillus lasiicapitis]|uniref:DUF6366 family protein n=1 Tax=Psychrobacillus lasiicapitis TaxID=1636719 RepID=UPI001E4AEC6C|nr:DUF6366 family protein [Psychrobacillus lasiicapitis]
MISKKPQKKRRLRQCELINNLNGSLPDALKGGSFGNLTDLTGGMGWKGTGIHIL